MIEKKLSSKVVFAGSFLKVRRDEVELSNGNLATREYIQHPGAALILPVLNNGNLVLIRQYRYPLHRNFLEFPAGKIDPGESPEQTARRELSEEVGYRPGQLQKLSEIHPGIGYTDEIIHLFLATDLIKTERHPDPDEILEVSELSIPELLRLVWQHQLTDVKTQIALFWYLRKIKYKL